MPTSFARLVREGEVDDFNRRVREYEEENGELPSLEMEGFEDLELSGFDFSRIDFSYAEFGNCTLTDVRFDGATLDGAFLHGCTFVDCYFDGVEGGGLAIENCTLSQCLFRGGEYADVEWTDTQFTECDFDEFHAESGLFERITVTEGNWTGVEVIDSELSMVKFRSVGFENCDLSRNEARSCYVTGSGEAVGIELPDGFRVRSQTQRRTLE
jgi:uncharacterized protein YjbI with pentapeptide repeats